MTVSATAQPKHIINNHREPWSYYRRWELTRSPQLAAASDGADAGRSMPDFMEAAEMGSIQDYLFQTGPNHFSVVERWLVCRYRRSWWKCRQQAGETPYQTESISAFVDNNQAMRASDRLNQAATLRISAGSATFEPKTPELAR